MRILSAAWRRGGSSSIVVVEVRSRVVVVAVLVSLDFVLFNRMQNISTP